MLTGWDLAYFCEDEHVAQIGASILKWEWQPGTCAQAQRNIFPEPVVAGAALGASKAPMLSSFNIESKAEIKIKMKTH